MTTLDTSPAAEAAERLREADGAGWQSDGPVGRPAPPAGAVPPSDAGADGDADDAPDVPVRRVLLSAGLASAAAAWVAAGTFEGLLARPLAVLAAALGVMGVGVALKRGRGWLQYLVLPAAFTLGYLAAILLPNDTGATGTVPELVRRALSNGGLSTPPVPFDPGWRVVLVTLLVVVGASAASLATGLRRPRLAVAVPVPVVVAASLLQPEGAEVVSGGVALVLLVAALMATYTAEVGGAAGASRSDPAFQRRQLMRGAGALLGALAALVVLSRASLLFPEPDNRAEAKPQKPTVVPLSQVADRTLFTVRSELDGPWRLGVLDEYDGTAWLLPPFDPDRVEPLVAGEPIEGAPDRPPVTSTFTVADLGGFTLPTPAATQQLEGFRGELGADPRTQVVRSLSGAPAEGYSYVVRSAAPPGGSDIAARATPIVPAELERFVQVPPAPLPVVDLLATAPPNPWERLQAVRARLYENVVAAGSGVPVDVPPQRVVDMLRGADATPYEIVAAEALLARWAGVPARIGYGFKGGEAVGGDEGHRELHPRDGANWLEAWFDGFGWVPVLGIPPKARASLTTDDKQEAPQARPSDELSLQVYIPIESPNPLLAFEVVRYWLFASLPFVVGAGVAAWGFPYPLKRWRSRRRRAWGIEHGPGGRVAVAYAEMRDRAEDLGVGRTGATPLEYLEAVDADAEHEELAWLTTRALYGDLARDLRDADAAEAERLSRSVASRLATAQPATTRISGAVSRSSLRAPYDTGLPNPWPAPKARSEERRARSLIQAPTRLARRLRSAARPRSAGART